MGHLDDFNLILPSIMHPHLEHRSIPIFFLNSHESHIPLLSSIILESDRGKFVIYTSPIGLYPGVPSIIAFSEYTIS